MSFSSNRIIKANAIEGIKTDKNYFEELSYFENGHINLVGYSDGTTRPTGTFGGATTNLTKSIYTANALENASSLKLTRSGACQGQGYYFQFTPIRLHLKSASMLRISFRIELISGTFLGSTSPTIDSDIIIGVYDTANSKIIEPSTRLLEPMVAGYVYEYRAEFQIPTNGTNFKFFLHHATTNTSAFELGFDDFKMTENPNLTASLNSDWKLASGVNLFGATNGLAYTNQTTTCYEKINGDSIQFRIRTSWTGAPATGTGKYEWSLPSGRTADNTKINVSSSATIGHISYIDSGTAFKENAYPYLTSTTRISVASDGGVDRWDTTTPITWATNDAIEIVTDPIPIVGLGSMTKVSDGFDSRKLSAKIVKASQGGLTLATQNLITFTSTDATINDAAMIETNKIRIISSGEYEIKVKAGSTSASDAEYCYLFYKINGGSSVSLGGVINRSYATPVASGSERVELKSNDYVEMLVQTNNGTTVQLISFSVSKVQSPQTISMSNKVAALYTGIPTGTLGNAWNKATFGTKVEDTHNAYVNGVYTIQEPGSYSVSAQTSQNCTSVSGGAAVTAIAIDNVTTYNSVSVAWSAIAGVTMYPIISIEDIPLNVGQTVTIQTLNNNTTPAYNAIVANPNWFSIVKVK